MIKFKQVEVECCDICMHEFEERDVKFTRGDTIFCEDCAPVQVMCGSCGENYAQEDVYYIFDDYFCPDCIGNQIDAHMSSLNKAIRFASEHAGAQPIEEA